MSFIFCGLVKFCSASSNSCSSSSSALQGWITRSAVVLLCQLCTICIYLYVNKHCLVAFFIQRKSI